MKNTPSALKWLAEKRGRLSHDLVQTERIAIEVNKRLAKMRLDLVGLDRTIQVFDPAIDPTAIAPVHAHRHPGTRGSLRGTMIELLQANSPEWTSTDVIEIYVTATLGLTFELAAERKRWYDNVFRKQLKRLVLQELAEREQDPTGFTSEVGRWRWKTQEEATLAELRAVIPLV
ncbi:MAG: hypothetical protein ABIZ18_07040 [Caldimonas sp.]